MERIFRWRKGRRIKMIRSYKKRFHIAEDVAIDFRREHADCPC